MIRLGWILCLLIALLMPASAQQARSSQRKPAAKTSVRNNTNQKATATQQKRGTATRQRKGQQGRRGKKTQQPSVSTLQNERKKLQQDTEAKKKRKAQVEQNVRQGMNTLLVLNSEINEKRRTINTISKDIMALEHEMVVINQQIDTLSSELEDRKQRYMKSMRYLHRNRSIQNQMMFVFSADNFNQMYRRMRFAREYAAYQKAQGEAVKSKQEQVTKKKLELAESKVKKDDLLAKGEREKKNLEGRQNAQQQQVAQLKKQQKTVEALIVEQQRKEEELNARIDKLIAEEIAREKARQEAEARRKAEAEAARKRAEEQARQKELAKKEKGKSGYHVAEPKPSEVRKTASKSTTAEHSTAEAYAMPAADRQLSGSFEANRGRLPLPITGSYRLVRGFGPYSPEGLSKVTLQSNGWHLKGQGGAKVQSVFDGEVSGVYYQGGSYIVTVRHGKYISAYINLASVSVRKGQRVKTRDVLGGLGADLTMQFQLRNWNQLLNPSGWIAR